MQKKRNISSPKAGMNRDTHSSLLKPSEYTLAINANTENETGEKLNITNEPSNYLAVVFPAGFKVIGFKYNLPSNKTYFWLTNPETKKSSVGYIDSIEMSQENVDQYNQCTECKGFTELGTPLENVEQTPFNNYVTLFDDINCEETLEFDLNYPIKNIEVKNEKGQVTAYWDDNKNPSRFAVLSDPSYLFSQTIPCEEEEQLPATCLFVDRLLHFPNYTPMNIQAEGIQTGGNLKLGTYEFWGTYCDIKGNNIVNYSTPTQPISIFDENNSLLEQTELDSFTNYSIKLTVNNLDTTFAYYKIVCVERTNINNTQSAFVAGIYPTTDNTVLYSSSGTSNDDEYLQNGNASIRRRIDFNELYQVRPTYKSAKGTTSSGNILWKWGLKEKETLNLQPVVNLFGSLLKWQTSVAKESLFKSPVACSKYKGYMRNEVQPFALRFYDLDGNYTPVFPIIGRPSIDDEKEDLIDTNYESIDENTPNCSQAGRTERWQILNTAKSLSTFGDLDWDCDANIEIITTPPEPLQKTCSVENVHTITTNIATIENPGEYVDLVTFIEENPNIEIENISQYINADYPDDTCPPNFTSCDTPVLIDNYNEVVSVETEVIELALEQKYVIYNLVAGDDFSNVGYEEEGKVFISTDITPKVWTNSTEVFLKKEVIIDSTEKPENNYKRSIPPNYCPSLEIDSSDGKPIPNTEFQDEFMRCSGGARKTAYKRQEGNIVNEDCQYAVPLENNNTTSTSGQAYFHNYSGSTNILELQLFHETHVASQDANFTANLHKGALWFSVEKLGRDKIIFEVTKLSNCSESDEITKLAKDLGNRLRYNVYSDCSVATPSTGEIFNAEEGKVVSLDCSTLGDIFYIAIDAPIVEQEVPIVCPNTGERTVYKVVPPCGCYTPYTRDVIYTSITIEWSSIVINKYSKYQANCTYQFPKLNDCDPVAYENGEFAYWQSEEAYPDNKELYDSSELIIRTGDLATLTQTDKERFLEFYSESIEGDTIQLKDANFRCQAIRHPKMPDNTLTSFMSTQVSKAFVESLIFPLGVSLDENVVKTMIQVAVNNNLITQKQADNIAGYEVLKGDNTIHKSIIANGLGYDLYKYKRDKQDYYYANYPFNDLGKDVLHYTDSNRSEFVEHPFEGQGNNKFTIISPDLFLNTPTLSTEMVMSGYQLGNSRGSFPEVKDHPKWTILSQKARRTAEQLATAEVVLDVALSVSELTKEQWAHFGLTNGGNFGSYVSLAIFAVAKGFSAFMQQGKYRYEWIKTFRDLGTQYNFASYGVAEGFHNNFLKNTEESEYIRGLPLAKYVKDGEYKYVDESTTKTVNLNNHLREHSVFVSSGAYNFNYAPIYSKYDNSTENPSQASRTITSQNNCKPNEEYTKNVGSPYFTLKNYIPDQFGTIDSIKWLTTNYSFKLQDEGVSCTTIFGGTVSISRFTWKKKIPIFKATAMGLPNKLAVEYLPYKNIAEPRFYCDYEVDGEHKSLGVPFPDIDSRYNFDCKETRGFYVKPNSKFYLYYYGITNFLVESEINCNFRYGKREPKNQFYPQVGDLKDWTQEVNVPIKEPNTFYYNNVYSLPVSNSPFSFLDATYSKLLWESRGDQENAVIYSEPDNSQNEIFDSWRVFKPLNWNEFDKKYGKLIGLKDLESSQLLAQFENGMLVLGAVDSLADRITPQNRALGTAGIFSTRPTEFKRTDLGFAGTQNTEIVSTPYGHLWADALRGKVFMLDQNAKGLEIISEMLANQPTGMKNWFKENLPFKILKDFPSADIDNKYKGLGLNIWYDSRFDRVFITKKDYISKGEECLKYEEGLGFYKDCEETVISCPTGYTYNEDTEMCEKITTSDDLCPIGYTYNEELQTCTLIEVVNAECPVIDENTQINIWFDNSGSMNTTLPKLQEMRDTILKPCIGAIYGYDPLVPGSDANYNSKVQVLNFSQNEDSNERYIKLLAKTSADPTITKVINLAFADEADRYGAVGGFGGNITSDASIDISTLRSILEGGDANSLVGVVFQVATGGVSTPTYPGFRTFVTNLHTGIAPFTGVSGLGDKPEISYVLDVIPASTPTYYTNLIIAALNNLGFALEPCIP